MAKKNTSRKRDNTLKGAIIGLLIFVVAVGTALAINAHSLSFIGTLDGQRIPMSHFHFQRYSVQTNLGDNIWFMDELSIAEITFESLVEFYNTAARADSLGVYLSADDISAARTTADNIRQEFINIYGSDQISAMGFSRSGFYSFIEKLTLATMVADHIVENVVVDEAEVQQAYEDFLIENAQDFIEPFVFMAEFDTMEEALDAQMQVITQGVDIAEFVAVSRGEEDANLIESRSLADYPVTQEQWNFALQLSPGMMGEIEQNLEGRYFIYQLDQHVEEIPGFDIFAEWHLNNAGTEVMRNYVDVWLNQADVQQNSRIFNRFQSFDMPMFDMGDLDFDIVEVDEDDDIVE